MKCIKTVFVEKRRNTTNDTEIQAIPRSYDLALAVSHVSPSYKPSPLVEHEG